MNSIGNSTFISIVIPVYNAEDTIEELVDRILEELKHDQYFEIVLVNDGSTDASEEVCINSYNKNRKEVKFLSLSRNFGEHNAVMAGLNHVSGDYVVIMDDDFQNPVSEVTKLIVFAVENDYDVVYTYYERKKHSFFRNMGSWFNDKIANVMLKKPKNLYLSSFKIMSSFIVTEIIKYDLPFPYIDGLILRITDNIGRIKVKHSKRVQGESGYTFRKLIAVWLNMFTNFSILPLRISITIGFIFAIFGFSFGVQIVYEKLVINPDLPIGYASIIVIVSIFAGIQLIAIGMLGEYLGRIFLSQNKKPQFTIKKRLL